MDVEVFLTSNNLTEEDVAGRSVVVIDVLRASATIITALQHGARDVVPMADRADAGKLASNLDAASYLLGGERGGEKIEGYHLGNSPLEYTEAQVKGRTIIFTTTNGTNAIARARTARHLLIGSFLNADRVVDFLRQADTDVVIVCAGRRNRVSLEDTLCAGLMLYRLWDGQVPGIVSDTAYMAFTQYRNDQDHLQDVIRHSNHAQWLSAHGYDDDVAYCTQVDALPVLPYYRENRLQLTDTSVLDAAL
ncbi:MAG: 2-phosphosulfolactate phosphatase [Rhodothermales bacterium]|nr:2-phosphosulfolactate phosphatase [Rhodothermales bacterium]